MFMYSKRRPFDIQPFKNTAVYEARYGLPLDVKFCKKCVISNQRPNSAVEYGHTKQSLKKTEE